MSNIPLAVFFALLTTAFNALATVLQRKAAARVPVRGMGRGLFAGLVRQRVFLAGLLVVMAAACCQAVALSNGPLSIVQPIFVLELLIALLLAGAILHRRVPRRIWVAAVCVSSGLGVALWAAAPTAGTRETGGMRWMLATTACLGCMAALTALGARRRPGPVRAASLALAAALGYALTAALLKAAALAWQSGGAAAFFSLWQTYGFAVVGILALFLLENALQSGSLAFSQPALTLGDACTSITLGVLLYGERIRTGGWLAVQLVGAAVVAVGIVLLSRDAATHDLVARRPSPAQPPAPGAVASRPEDPGPPAAGNS
jgi:drug/metabolite transporter (DMT)-like permease